MVNIISLSAKTHIFKKVAESSKGSYHTILDESHYWQLLSKIAEPPEYKEENVSR